MTTSQLVPALLIPLVAWRIYRRFRRYVGRQPVRSGRLKTTIWIWSVITVLFGLGAVRYAPSLAGLAGGLAVSICLAWLGVRLTKFETASEGKYYTPNTTLGVAVTVLFVGRLAYRLLVLGSVTAMSAPITPQAFESPLTYFLFGLSAGYYIAYSAGVLLRSHRPEPAV
jgi:hypothetical protein